MNQSAEHTDVYIQDFADRDQAAASELADMAATGMSSSVNDSMHSITRSIVVANSTVVEGLPDEQKTSPVRRVYCLLCLFDLIGIFIIWVIYVRLISDAVLGSAFLDQIKNFRIESSMFDIMMLALLRLLIQEFAYGIMRAHKPWWTAISTSITNIYLLVKIFKYDFKHTDYYKNSPNVMDYILMLASFVICWVETWFLDFRVLPREKAARQLTEETASLLDSQSGHFDRRYNTFDRERFFSPTASTPIASTRFSTARPTAYHSISGSPVNTTTNNYSEVQPFLLKASETFDQACSLFSDGHEWTHEKGDGIHGCVYSRKLSRKVRIYKVEVLLPISPDKLFQDFISNVEETPTWNPSIAAIRRVQSLSPEADIIYSISTEQMKGAVSPRDCVNIRKWSQISRRLYLIAEQSVEHPNFPVTRQFVRAVNGVGLMAFEEVAGMAGQCKFTWVLNTNIKGWLPQSVVDQTMAFVMYDYLDIIRKRVDQLLGVS